MISNSTVGPQDAISGPPRGFSMERAEWQGLGEDARRERLLAVLVDHRKLPLTSVLLSCGCMLDEYHDIVDDEFTADLVSRSRREFLTSSIPLVLDSLAVMAKSGDDKAQATFLKVTGILSDKVEFNQMNVMNLSDEQLVAKLEQIKNQLTPRSGPTMGLLGAPDVGDAVLTSRSD